jgi:hypothetical protein
MDSHCAPRKRRHTRDRNHTENSKRSFGPFDNTNQPLSTSPTQTIEHSMSSTTEPQPPGSTPRAQKISYPASHSKLGTLWSRSLPEYSGEYPVGAVDVEFPIPKQRMGRFVHKKVPGGEAGIEIDTVLFTMFYPCQVDGSREKGALWFPRFVGYWMEYKVV